MVFLIFSSCTSYDSTTSSVTQEVISSDAIFLSTSQEVVSSGNCEENNGNGDSEKIIERFPNPHQENVEICLITTVLSDFEENLNSNTSITYSVEIQPRLDVQEWKYKISNVDGKVYKRLWSQTRGIWLTDWIPLV